jgi:uncharacterized CHY-type Zn-finger protein
MGGDGEIYHDIECPNPKHILTCSKCGNQKTAHRLSANKKIEYMLKERVCGICRGVIIWTQLY